MAGDCKHRRREPIHYHSICQFECFFLIVGHEYTGDVNLVMELPQPAAERTAIRPISVKIAVLANQLRRITPAILCDRLIGATALAEGIALITKDSRIRACQQIKTIW